MFILIDVILVAVLVICMIIGWVKGFIDEVLRLLSGLLAFFIALFLTPHIAPVLNDHLFYGRISGYMSEQMDEIDRNNEGDMLEEGKANDALRALLEKLGADYDEIKESISKRANDGEQALKEGITEKAAKPVSYAISYAICFVVLFLVSLLLLWILRHVLDLAAKLPVIKTANKILGLAVGAVLGILIVWVLSAMLKLGLPYLSVMAPKVFPPDLFERSYVLRLTYYLNALRGAVDFSYIKRLIGI